MIKEKNLTWEFLKIVADTLDSYRIRAFIDAKEEIKNANVYNEQQYYGILYKMLDQEILKYSLFESIKNKNTEQNLNDLKEFAEKNNIELKKALSLLELLKYEGLVEVNELTEQISETENEPPKIIFKGLKIKIKKTNHTSIKSIYEPVKIIFNSKICSGCGLCEGICPVNCLNIENGIGLIDENKCLRCGLCYYICPRSYLPVRVLNMYQENSDEFKEYGNIGFFKEAYSARTKIDTIKKVCQDGGITSTCLYYLFESNKIEAAIGAKMSDTLWKPEPFIMNSINDVIKTAGTKYVSNPNLKILNNKEIFGKRIAIAGVPCMMQALLKNQIYDINFPSLSNIQFRIGIFCMESFPYDGFLKICEKLNVDVNDIKKTDINKGKFFVYTKDGNELSIPIKEITNLAREDCEVCFDLTSEAADISIGSIGAPAGWNTVIIRTNKGKQLFNDLIKNDLIEYKPIEEVKPGLQLLLKIAAGKRNKAKKHINSKMEKNQKYPQY
ncbi:MAG: Coenzyme F420 hydrogenase/dehydrogenase, beta subunit C-terminal domain [Promethearchaeia archaeon]